jgi:hypothetical protein
VAASLNALLYHHHHHHHQTTTTHLPSTFRLLTADHSPFLRHIHFFQIYMSQFQGLFNAALQDYENQTGTRLVDHPFAKQLETCDSVNSVTAILQEQAQIFHEFRGDDGKLMKSLKSSVEVLHTPSISAVLGESIGLVRPKSFIVVTRF